MVPLSDVRHRIHEQEFPVLLAGLMLVLKRLRSKGDEENSEVAYQLLQKFLRDKKGRPKYKKSSWMVIDYDLAILPARDERMRAAKRLLDE